MDAVFLEVLAADWLRAPEYFMQLFGSVQVEDTVAFLTDQASWRQRLQIMLSLPVRPFARVALQRCLRARRSGNPPNHAFDMRQ